MLWLANIVAYIINVVVVGSSIFGALGRTNADVSDDNITLITPENWAFVIWSVIFLSELIFVIWQACNQDEAIVTEGISCWFALACLLQAAWSVVFAQELLIASAIILVAIAFSLGVAVIRLAPFKRDKTSICASISWWTVHFPIGLHGGWVLAAALVNINVALPSVLRTEVTALILSLIGAAFGAVIAAAVFHDQVYLLAIAWALGAIEDKTEYRRERLGEAIEVGVTDAIRGLWIALLVVAFITGLDGMRRRRERGKADQSRSFANERRPRDRSSADSSSRSRVKRGVYHQRDLTSAI